MPPWLQAVLHVVTAVLAAVSARNGQIVGVSDWQSWLPALGAGATLSAAPIWSFINNVIRSPNGLKLVAQLLPYREKMLPQEVRDAVFNAMRWRFNASPEAVTMIDSLIVIDMNLDHPAKA